MTALIWDKADGHGPEADAQMNLFGEVLSVQLVEGGLEPLSESIQLHTHATKARGDAA